MVFDPENLSDVAAALAQTFQGALYHQMNREAATLARLEGEVGKGKNCSWDTEFTGTTGTADAVAEGSDVPDTEYGTDIPVPATLAWSEYRTSFALTEVELIAAQESKGTPEELVNILGDRILLRSQLLAQKINQDLYSGTGTSGGGHPNIVGFHGGALAASGTYANINPATYTEWVSTVLANGGVPRALTLDLLAQAEEQLFRTCGRSPLKLLTSTGVRRKYAGLFQEIQRVVTGGPAPVRYDPVPGENEYFYQGAQVCRDRDAPSGKIIMLGMEPKVRFMPPLGRDKNTVEAQIRALAGGTGGPDARITGSMVPFQITPLAKTGTSVKFMLTARPQLVTFRRNAYVVISDISES